MKRISVVGAGAWGTALALVAFRAGAQVMLWSISREEVEAINQGHENVSRLPGILLDPSLHATLDPLEAAEADLVILAPPAQWMRSTCRTFQQAVAPHVPLVIASKGIEEGTYCLMTEVVRGAFPQNPLLVLSGPSFASDVARNHPTAVALAADTLALSQEIAGYLRSSSFHLEASGDLIGTQIGGACKNVIAIASGIIEGRGLGENARAALVTRGLAEIAGLGCAMGAKLETFLGLSGMGDILLTSLSSQSRNTSFGLALGQGTPLEELLASKKALTEGAHTVSGTMALAKKYQVNMPITFALHTFLKGEGHIEVLIENLQKAL